MKPDRNTALSRGDVAQFVYLHLDSAKKTQKGSHNVDHYEFTIEGKARPMIVFSGEPRKLYGGVQWYQVIRLTTEEKKGWTTRIGPILRRDEVSFGYAPEWYPESLLCKGGLFDALDIETFRFVKSIFERKALTSD